MTATLITFLGRGRDDPRTGYREATYRFPDGAETTTAFFGFALGEHLGAEELVILGTASSQWGVLVENLAERTAPGDDEDMRIELMEAESEGNIDQQLLDRCAPLMAKATGRLVKPLLIPFGSDPAEQFLILDAVADAVAEGTVDVDVTHGFRHLGMIGLLSASMLGGLGLRIVVRDVWYGALDMRDAGGIAPVVRLDGLQRIQRWLDALSRYDATGDYGVFAPLLRDDGVSADKTKCLEDAAYHERNGNLVGAVAKLGTFLPTLDGSLTGATRLFRPGLERRLSWARHPDYVERQRGRAVEYLKRGDYLRAALFGWETLITQECRRLDLNERRYELRQKAAHHLNKKIGQNPQGDRLLMKRLRGIRNTLAHGAKPQDFLTRLLRDRTKLHAELETTFEELLDPPRRRASKRGGFDPAPPPPRAATLVAAEESSRRCAEASTGPSRSDE